ncbi:MAG: phytoene desaturase family protein [Intrasporangium sp.]|uniref:phytoene desaturase family protein n=1 Tax=Intrasporangium sp. TaxID=1925024 RepID=UPI003F7FCF91
MPTTDAVVIGSGPNGLVAANLLADAGWDVLVLEEQPWLGGAVNSAADVRDGWIHDTCSSFYPLAAASPVIESLQLEHHGLEWVNAPAIVGNPLLSGDWAVLHRDRDDTAASLDALCPGDGDAWLAQCRLWDRLGEQLVGAITSPFPPVRAGLGLAARAPFNGGLAFVRQLLLPARQLGEEAFRGEAPRLLLAGNAAHADIGMESPGSGFMGWLLIMLGQHVGFPVPKGGAAELRRALVRRFEAAGGQTRRRTPVVEVIVSGGRASAVRTGDGEVIEARRAVLADVSAPALYGGLVSWEHLPTKLRRRMDGFEWDPGTIKVDWALSGPIPWAPAPPVAPGTVHLIDSVDALSLAEAQMASGRIPDRGIMLLGQMATTDPTRAPAGAESLWAYTHVPHGALRGEVSDPEVEAMADRMEARIEEHAPGFRDRILNRRILSPDELESRNANLVGGSINGGTAKPQQELIFRPVPGLGRAETPVRGLFLASAAAHPGGGVHGACGSNAARAALAHDRIRLRRSR